MTGCQGCSAGRASLVVGATALGAGVAYLTINKWFKDVSQWAQVGAMAGSGGLAGLTAVALSGPKMTEQRKAFESLEFTERLHRLNGYRSDFNTRGMAGLYIDEVLFRAGCNLPEELPEGIQGWSIEKQHKWVVKQEAVTVTHRALALDHNTFQCFPGNEVWEVRFSSQRASELLTAFGQAEEVAGVTRIDLVEQQNGGWKVGITAEEKSELIFQGEMMVLLPKKLSDFS